MTKGERQLAGKWLARAEAALGEAEMLLDGKYLAAAVSRTYYACFFAATGLLLTRDLHSSKHSGVLSHFDREFANKGVVPKEYGRFLHTLYDFRLESDYTVAAEFTQGQVRDLLQQARPFVRLLAGLVERAMQ